MVRALVAGAALMDLETPTIAVGERTHYTPLVAEGLTLRGQLEQETSGLTRTQMKRQLLDKLAARFPKPPSPSRRWTTMFTTLGRTRSTASTTASRRMSSPSAAGVGSRAATGAGAISAAAQARAPRTSTPPSAPSTGAT